MVRRTNHTNDAGKEKAFRRNIARLKNFAEELEKIDVLRSFREKKTKKVISDWSSIFIKKGDCSLDAP